ncbi:MAG: AtpZ/AtpI family protein [Balneolales bacterium]
MQINSLNKYGEYIALGTNIAASMIIPVVIGIYVDKYWNLSPWGVVIGALLGFGGMISIVIKLAAQTGESEYTKRKKPPGNGKVQ